VPGHRFHTNKIKTSVSSVRQLPVKARSVFTDCNTAEEGAQALLTSLPIRHAYIKPASPQLNGKAERSHRTDEQEFYQLLTCTDVSL
jgi:hypothetical protein